MPRNTGYEDQWLSELAREAARQAGVNVEQLVALVHRRLELGDRLFGDAFLADGWDGCREGIEEAADLVIYPLLESERRIQEDRGGLHHLLQAAVHAAIADAHLRAAMRDD